MLTPLRISDRRLSNPNSHEDPPSTHKSYSGGYWTQPVYDGDDATAEPATRDDWLISGLCSGYSMQQIGEWLGISEGHIFRRKNELLASGKIVMIPKVPRGYTYGIPGDA